MAYGRPGVYVTESLNAPSTTSLPSLPASALVAACPRGPVVPTNITNWSDFVKLYGGFGSSNDTLAMSVYQYINNGGSNVWVVRAVGASSSIATRTLNDREAGNPPPGILQVDAFNPGAWGNNVFVEVTDTGVSGRFNFNIRYGGTSDQFLVEQWKDASMNPSDPRYIVALCNSEQQGSVYVDLTDLNSGAWDVTKTPVASTNPGGDALATGADGAAPTQGATGQYLTAVQLLDRVSDSLVLNLPGITDPNLINAVIAYASARKDIFLVIDCQAGRSASQVIADAGSITQSSYAALYYPRIFVSDPSVSTRGATTLIPAGPSILGQFASSDASKGVWKSPAGVSTRLSGVVKMETQPSNSDYDSLNNAHVNAIRNLPNVGPCIFGVRSLKLTQEDMYIGPRRTLIFITKVITTLMLNHNFDDNDSLLWGELTDIADKVLRELFQNSGLAGTTPSEAYYVKCDTENNTSATIDAGETHIEIGVALQRPSEFIVIAIGQTSSGVTSNES